ncbi:PIR Superfamily Protein [Plasmodium ovale wallikeri]|uniref:PIR Superfamily Protein n=1 Tax=Plasmodium ovale wallikeri TaxID=864142 RepID=A0A1A9ALI2_PLAOA|nr:PIR Superfamily Protein [Plasmodium ovale wallikeri]
MSAGSPQGNLFRSSKELYSEQFYETLNYDYPDLSNYYDKCNNKLVLRNKRDEMITVCERILRYLENSTALNTENSSYNVCTLFNYWIYDTLAGIYGAENTTDIAHAFSSLQLIWGYLNYNSKNFTFYKNCKPSFDSNDLEDWKQRKQLHDYCVNYDFLKLMAKNFEDTCEEYYKKIEENSSLYEYFENLCSKKPDKCPNFYNKCESYNPKLVLTEIPCHNKIKKTKAPAGEGTERSSALKQGPGQDHLSSALGPVSRVPGLSDSPHGTKSTTEGSQIGTKVGQSILGIAPVLFTATALYRYTPVGPWIRRLSGNTNNVSDMEEFSSYTQETGDIFTDSSANYITYHPM